MHARSLILAVIVIALAACGSSGSSKSSTSTQSTNSTLPDNPAAYFAPRPADPLKLVRDAGLVPEKHETLIHHVHAHLDIFVNGSAKLIPGGVGINITDPGVNSASIGGYPAYGGIKGCAQPCISPLHTHDASGVLHTESATNVNNTLGEFFTEWGVTLDQSCAGTYCAPQKPLAWYVNGQQFTGDPRTIELTDQLEIALVIGTPPAVIPQAFPSQ